MADAKPQSLTLATSDGRLRLEFHWQRDRFVQQLFVDSVEAGNSIEGDAEDSWPSSPPLQQLSLEDINGSSVILGVGAAGRGHWSISVEIDHQSDGADAIKFELACRSKEQPPFLGSSYRLAIRSCCRQLTEPPRSATVEPSSAPSISTRRLIAGRTC